MFIFQEKSAGYMTMLIVLFLAGVACKEEQAEPKFVALAQQVSKTGVVFTGKFLISRVQDKEWKLFYGFADNNYCNGAFREEIESIKSTVLESIGVWLAPLRDKGDIIALSHIILQEKDTQSLYSPEQKEALRLLILFYCEEGRSFARIRRDSPQIHMKQRNGQYQSYTLHHEMGHVFGLGDTYVEHQKADRTRRFNQSTGGHSRTVGKQPLAVMNSSFRTAVNAEGKLQLTPDDVAGIKWLYRYYVEKSIDICDCPYEYVYEKETGGCRPQHPFIIAAKQGIYLSYNYFAENSLTEDDGVEELYTAVMRRQDEHGNTILHYYAANLAHREQLYADVHAMISLKDTDILNIKNKLGKTAADIYAVENPASLLYSPVSLAAAKRGHQQEAAKVCEPIALRLAVLDGDTGRVESLLASSYIDVNKQHDNDGGDTVLQTAVAYLAQGREYVDIVALLLAHKDIDLLVKNIWEETAFTRLRVYFTESRLKECMQSFISSADFNAGLAYFNRIGPLPPLPEEADMPPPPPSDAVYPPSQDLPNADPNTDPATVGRPPPPIIVSTDWCDTVKLFYHTRGG